MVMTMDMLNDSTLLLPIGHPLAEAVMPVGHPLAKALLLPRPVGHPVTDNLRYHLDSHLHLLLWHHCIGLGWNCHCHRHRCCVWQRCSLLPTKLNPTITSIPSRAHGGSRDCRSHRCSVS